MLRANYAISTFRRLVMLCILYFLSVHVLIAQRDTLSISLQEAEKRFIDSNFLLLAAHYNVDAQKALIEQAKYWPNPVLNTDQVIAAGGRFLPYGKAADGSYSGQYYVQVQQLIQTAKKRGRLIDMASTNARIAELQLQEVIRNLRFQLRTDYYTLHQQLLARKVLLLQLDQLNKLYAGMQQQLKAGNIAQKDLVRIQALVVATQQDITEAERSIEDYQQDMKSLLRITEAKQFILPSLSNFQQEVLPESLVTCIDLAKTNNPFFLLQEAGVKYQAQNLAYQKALRVPDIVVGPNFDRNSNFSPNYVGLGISLPLPVFNTNKGNIRNAEFSVKQQQAITDGALTDLVTNIQAAYEKLALSIKQNNSTQQSFYTQYANVYEKMFKSYQERQIGLLEFLDFFTDYQGAQQRLLQQKLNLQLSKETLNYFIGKELIK